MWIKHIHKLIVGSSTYRYVLLLVMGICLSLQSGCVFVGQRGTMLRWRVGWNEHQRPTIICERTEARPPKRDRVNQYRWQHGELLSGATPVSYSELTPDIPKQAGEEPPSYADPFLSNEAVVTPKAETSALPPVLPQDLAPVQVPQSPESKLPPPIWAQPESKDSPVESFPAAPTTPAPALPENPPEVLKKEDASHIAQNRRSIFNPVSFKR